MFDMRVTQRFRDTSFCLLRCNRGRVMDFSTRGLRLLTRRPWTPGTRKEITLELDGHTVTLQAEAAWSNQRSLFRHTVGVTFTTITPEARETLEHFAARIAPPGLLTLPTGEHIGLSTGTRAA